MIGSEYKNIKMILRIKLIGQKSIKLKFVKVHPNILSCVDDSFFYSKEQIFTFTKSSYLTLITPTRLTIPSYNNSNRVSSYVFRNEKERYKTLLKFSKTLKELSLSSHFYYENINFKDNTLLYYKNNWTLY